MTRQSLIDALAHHNRMSKRQVDEVLSSLVDIIATSIKAGNKVSITGFGTFDVGTRAARRGVNPQTGAEIQIPAMPMPRFRAGKRLKDAVR